MGGSNEFFDKFSIRYHVSVILKQLWEHPTHQVSIKIESANTQDNASFMRFINMLINDTTFLLDESLDALKAIRDTQEAMRDKETWDSQPPVSCERGETHFGIPVLGQVGMLIVISVGLCGKLFCVWW